VNFLFFAIYFTDSGVISRIQRGGGGSQNISYIYLRGWGYTDGHTTLHSNVKWNVL